ncbi:MAG: DUF6084 family protein [Actinomycetota bacterium]|nr:hypothetical protein [Nocardioidaceae bacterium]MDQ3479774.1 DUF6084 family protein [Actinomycetota bacterium]
MSDLGFSIIDVFAEPYAAAPQLTARLRIEESSEQVIHAIALRAQVRIEPQRRRYSEAEESGLLDMFGTRDRWYDTLKPFMWMQCSTMVQGFTGITEVDLAMPCTYDFEVTWSKYLHALREETIPVVFLFSGTVFTRGVSGFGVEQVPWDREATYKIPVKVWKDLIHYYFPNTGWLRLSHDTLETLAHYKSVRGLTTWEATVESLLAKAGVVS